MHGHLAAHLDPLGSEPPGDPALEPERLIPKLTLELQSRIPARLLRTYVEGETLAEQLPHLRETYCGTIAYEIEHISDHEERVWLREAIESGPLSRAALERREARAADAAHGGRGAGDVPPQGVPRAEAVLDRRRRRARADARSRNRPRRRERRARGRDGNGAPRATQRPRARRRLPVRDDPPRVRRRADVRRGRVGSRGRQRRREVPPRRAGRALDEVRRDHRHARREPEPPRSRRPGRRGPHPRRPDRPFDARGSPRSERRDADPDSRRCGVPRAGNRRGDAEPLVPCGLLDRRHAARDHEQPGRVHDGPRRRAVDALRERPCEGIRRADLPRQRRRPRGGDLCRATRDRVSPQVLQRRRHRPRRLPAPRTSRAGRAGLHAAVDGEADRVASARARGVRRAAHRRGRRYAGGSSTSSLRRCRRACELRTSS